jgi:hypothetical protein
MAVVVVYLGHIGIGDDDEGEILKGLNTVSESSGQERKGEIGGGEESGISQWWFTMSDRPLVERRDGIRTVLDEIRQCQRSSRSTCKSIDLFV